jgi:Flp pilus assembly protein TadD
VLATWLYNHHEFRSALPLLTWLAERRAGDREAARGILGMTWIRLGRLDRAAAEFEALSQEFPASWAGPYHRGLAHLKRQEFVPAHRAFAESVRRQEGSPFGLHGLGVSLFKLGRDAEAAVALQKVLELMPRHPSARFDLMNALRRVGDTAGEDREHKAYWARRPQDGATLKPIEHTVSFKVAAGEVGGMRFTDVAEELGMADPGRGRASAFVDVDGDGHLDVFAGNNEERSHLYRGDGAGGFSDVTDAAGLGWFDSGYGHAFADYDGDGDLDVYVTRGGFQNSRPGRDGNLLFRNDGDGRFTDVTDHAGVGDAGTGFASVWGDFDGDGPVDLYVVNNYTANRLLRNRGDGTFEDITDAAGVGDMRGGISAAVADFDDDGDLDIYVANNGQSNVMYRNDGGAPLRFTDVTGQARVGVSGGFASVAADFDNDGRMDIYVSNMNNWFGGGDFRPGDACYLLLNQGDGSFVEVAKESAVAYVGGPMGLNAGDLDYDGWTDLYLGNGGPEPRRWEPDVLYRNLGRPPPGSKSAPRIRFANVTKAAGAWNDRMGHGLSMGDYDRDGDLDIYLPNGAHVPSDLTPNKLWRNDGRQGHWIALELEGRPPNTAAIGARATIYAADHVQVQEVSGGHGFGAQNSLALEFGLGARTKVDRIEVRWPSGARQTLRDPEIDRFLAVTETAVLKP